MLPSVETIQLALLPFAAVGAASSVLEGAATSVGAGILLGGFVAGTVQRLTGMCGGAGREDDGVVDAGYGGGWIAVAVLVGDLLVG